MVHGAWCVVCRGDASVKGLDTPLTATGEFGRFMRRGEAEGELARLAAAKQRAQRLSDVQSLPTVRVRQGRGEERDEFASPLRKMEAARLKLNAG